MIAFEPPARPQHGAVQQQPSAIGANYVLVCTILPYTVTTALQDTHTKAACIAGTAAAGGAMLLGLLLRLLGGRRMWPYVLELALLVVFAVQLIVACVEKGRYTADIARFFPFITNSSLAGITVISIIIGYPLTLQNVREAIPRTAWRHPAVYSAAYLTTGTWLLVFTINTLIFLAPYIDGKEGHHFHVLNLLLRIILPILFFAAAAIFTCLWPASVEVHLQRSIPFDAASKKVIINQVYAMDEYA